MAKKATIKITKNQSITLSLNGITRGELLALRHALESYSKFSPVGDDVRMYVTNAVTDFNADSKGWKLDDVVP